MADHSTYLLVLGEREAIRWVVTSGRMAFPATPRREVADLREGDRLLLVSTRGAFHNPTRDRTRVIGAATVVTTVEPFDDPVALAGRVFASGCSIKLESLAPYLDGVELAPLVERLDAFRGHSEWGMMLRRPLVFVSNADEVLLSSLLAPLTSELAHTIAEYESRIVPVRQSPSVT